MSFSVLLLLLLLLLHSWTPSEARLSLMNDEEVKKFEDGVTLSTVSISWWLAYLEQLHHLAMVMLQDALQVVVVVVVVFFYLLMFCCLKLQLKSPIISCT